jgi:HlyD family secretion protein
MKAMNIGGIFPIFKFLQLPLLGLGLVALLMAGCQKTEENVWQGYVEGEYVRVASPIGGALTTLSVHRGNSVKAGDTLFSLEKEAETAACNEAAERLKQTQARLENLKKGRRPTEISSVTARLDQARASLKLAEADAERAERLFKDGVLAASELDRVRATLSLDRKRTDEIVSELATAQLGARDDEIKAAEAEVAAAEATQAKALWSLQQKSQTSPRNALVQDTLYVAGEWVPAGLPVVSLLPPENLKVRFFVQHNQVSRLSLNQKVTVAVDGVPQGYPAHISYIAPQVEFTPPVIYSRENRSKLVFMAEATFEAPDTLRMHPGQPVEVKLQP